MHVFEASSTQRKYYLYMKKIFFVKNKIYMFVFKKISENVVYTPKWMILFKKYTFLKLVQLRDNIISIWKNYFLLKTKFMICFVLTKFQKMSSLPINEWFRLKKCTFLKLVQLRDNIFFIWKNYFLFTTVQLSLLTNFTFFIY